MKLHTLLQVPMIVMAAHGISDEIRLLNIFLILMTNFISTKIVLLLFRVAELQIW